jgi:initiation factor 1A
MVKNSKGGSKSKKMGRKFINAPVDNRRVRMVEEEGEIYGVTTKLLGNGMFYVNDPDGNERLCIMRNKFRGRGKRDNPVAVGGWVLIGEREFESCAKPKHDLLEVYNDIEKHKLKQSGNPIFLNLKCDHDKVITTITDDTEKLFEFTNNPEDGSTALTNAIHNTEILKLVAMDSDDDEEVDIGDI